MQQYLDVSYEGGFFPTGWTYLTSPIDWLLTTRVELTTTYRSMSSCAKQTRPCARTRQLGAMDTGFLVLIPTYDQVVLIFVLSQYQVGDLAPVRLSRLRHRAEAMWFDLPLRLGRNIMALFSKRRDSYQA
jgi:hypothetical protein